MNAFDESKLVGFLEAVYLLDLSDEEWLEQASLALLALCGREHNYVSFFYDASNVAELKVWNLCRLQPPPPELSAVWSVFHEHATPGFVRATFRSLFIGSAKRTAFAHVGHVLAERERNGHGDFYYLNGLDPSGVGCLLLLGSKQKELTLSANESVIFRRLATHLSSAFRCRRRLGAGRARSVESHATRRNGAVTNGAVTNGAVTNGAVTNGAVTNGAVTNGAEAILDTNGRVLHAEGPARDKAAQERLRLAATGIELVRAHRRRTQGERALGMWHPLTGARWTLVNSFEEGGRRYIVARENQAETRGFYELTERERQIVVHSAFGLGNKQIAYTLGISEGTVRVLMARAARRFGLRTRKELLEHAAVRDLCCGTEGVAVGNA